MRFFQVALIALTALVAPVFVSARLIDSSGAAEEFLRQRQWQQFKVEYSKTYATVEEEAARFEIFKQNFIRAAELSITNPLATFGVTRFSDLSAEEFKRLYLNYRPQTDDAAIQRVSRAVQSCESDVAPTAGDVDWRTKGAVTAVKDQGQCGSCWAFSAVEGVESAWFLKHGSLPVLSPQQVVSCDKVDGGCDGGDLPTAFAYIEKSGLTTEALYPYTSGNGVTGTCKSKVPAPVAQMTNFTYATPPCFDACKNQNEATLLTNLGTTGPSSICVYAEPWQVYTGGILTSADDCGFSYNILDHCVQLVGYSSTGSTPYWIVRNSWATSWGEDGYIYLQYGKNLCGVADEATFVISA